jgi:hypothetical protein
MGTRADEVLIKYPVIDLVVHPARSIIVSGAGADEAVSTLIHAQPVISVASWRI